MIPNMKDALFGFTRRAKYKLVAKAAADFEASETTAALVTFFGNFQPISPQRLVMKPEGQRNWKFLDMWSTQKLKNDDIIVDIACNKEYRVLSWQDWSEAGYYHYEITEQAQ